jgi:hypothetical protein
VTTSDPHRPSYSDDGNTHRRSHNDGDSRNDGEILQGYMMSAYMSKDIRTGVYLYGYLGLYRIYVYMESRCISDIDVSMRRSSQNRLSSAGIASFSPRTERNSGPQRRNAEKCGQNRHIFPPREAERTEYRTAPHRASSADAAVTSDGKMTWERKWPEDVTASRLPTARSTSPWRAQPQARTK